MSGPFQGGLRHCQIHSNRQQSPLVQIRQAEADRLLDFYVLLAHGGNMAATRLLYFIANFMATCGACLPLGLDGCALFVKLLNYTFSSMVANAVKQVHLELLL